MVTVSRARVRFLFALFAIASLVLSARVAYWQTVGRGDLLARATDQVRSDLVVAAQRGVIRDRAGAILATTVELRSLYAIPGQMKDRDGHDERPAGAGGAGPRTHPRPGRADRRRARARGRGAAGEGRRRVDRDPRPARWRGAGARVVSDVRPGARRQRSAGGSSRSRDRVDLRARLDD